MNEFDATTKTERLKKIAFWGGLFLSIVTFLLLGSSGWDQPAQIVGAVTVLCAVWWIFEPVPIPATSLIPVGVFPLTGALDKVKVAQAYGHYLIILLLGGFIISQAMEKSGTHKRLASGMIRLFGGKGKMLVFGFMAASGLLSMWISNTATTLMLLPIALAVLDEAKDKALTIPLLLGICYAASIGGMGTPIGTPPNAAYVSIYKEYTDRDVGFAEWMKMGIPLVFILLPVAGFWLTRKVKSETEVILPSSGTWRKSEIRTLTVFILIAIAWMTRKDPFGGWQELFGFHTASDADVAIVGAVILFLIPSGDKKGEKLMDWETAVKIPWGILLLFSGGLVIATAFKDSGLSSAVGSQLVGIINFHPFLLMLITCLAVTFLTEVTSNTASTLLLLPIIAETVIKSGVFPDPAILMIPATISASCAFMMPVATAPNAIIYGSQRVSINRMVREGFFLNVIFAFIISTFFYFVLL